VSKVQITELFLRYPITQTEVPSLSVINGLGCQTGISAVIERKRVFRPLSNRLVLKWCFCESPTGAKLRPMDGHSERERFRKPQSIRLLLRVGHPSMITCGEIAIWNGAPIGVPAVLAQTTVQGTVTVYRPGARDHGAPLWNGAPAGISAAMSTGVVR
jgi:hypothetical protein